MSPNSLRVLAGAAAAVIVLLTGIAVGLLGAAPDCAPAAPVQNAPTTSPATSTTPAGNGGADTNPGGTPGNNGGGINENQGGNTTGPGNGNGQGNGPGNGQGNGSLGGSVGSRPRADTLPILAGKAAEKAGATVEKPLAATAAECGSGEKFSIPTALAGVAGAGLAAVTLLAFLVVAQSRRPAVPVSGPPAAGGPSRGSDPRLDADRAALVRACIYVRDRVTSRALADRLAAALRDAGVNVVEPVGERFDPARHEAGGATPTKDATQTGTIAAVEVPGYVDRSGRVLRAPVVTVYQAGAAGSPGAQRPGQGAAHAVNQPSGAYPTVNPPSGAYPTVPPAGSPHPGAPRRTEEDR